ncbi:MAG: hypothetical protein OXI91_15275 [Chloroflexota bacterium]|nr:hypothetical protein [Chloroflexota bacterium]
MSKKGKLTRSQERRRIEGLRILARIIARHYLSHPELYPSPAGDGAALAINGPDAGDGRASGKGDGHGA